MAYVQVPPLPRGITKADYYDEGQSGKRRLDALVHRLDDTDFRPSNSLKRKAKDLEQDYPFSSSQPAKKKRGRKPKVVRSISDSIPSSGTQSASVPPARSISPGKNRQVILKSSPSLQCIIPPSQSISVDPHRPSTPVDNSNNLAISSSSPDSSLALSQAIPLPEHSPKNQKLESLPDEPTFTFENFDNVIWPSEGPGTGNIIQPFDEWPETTLFQIFTFGRHLREKKGLPPPTTYQQALEIAAGPGSPRKNSIDPFAPSIDMGPAVYGTLTMGTHGGGMTFSVRQHGSSHGSPKKKGKRRTWNSTANGDFLFPSSLAVRDDAETDPDAEGDIDMDYYINDFDTASGYTSHLPAPHVTPSVPKYAPREARSDILPLPDTSTTSFPANDMYMSDRQLDSSDIRPYQLNSPDTNTFPPDLGDTVNDPFVLPYDYHDSPWMSVDDDASPHPDAPTQNTWNGTIDPALLGGGGTLEPPPQSSPPPAFQSVKRVPRWRRPRDMDLSASESGYEDAGFKPGQKYGRAGPSNSSDQWEESSSSSDASLVIPQPAPAPTKKGKGGPRTKRKTLPSIVWETGPLSFCHQCRRNTTLAKMQCSQVRSDGVLCPLRYCMRCFVTR